MILYDQDFRFLGMSAETLTFLGYEDIDEFTSMHSDFSDLFVKKEGFIHKFENFSWIHYALYSGTANKKAYVIRKNGEEVCVDLTIKEICLNQNIYDGLRTIYGIKLINENFSQVSHNDVQNNHSAASGKSQFSLNSLTKDLNIPETPAVKEETVAVQENTDNTPDISAPLDFKLDIPEDSTFTPSTQTSETSPQKQEINVPLFDAPNHTAAVSEPTKVEEAERSPFALNFLEPEPATIEKESPTAHIDFGKSENAKEETVTSPAPQTSEQSLSETFKLNFPTQEEPKKTPVELNFDLPLTAEDTAQTHSETVTQKEPEHTDMFSFQLLKQKTSVETTEPKSFETPQTQQNETFLKLHEPVQTTNTAVSAADTSLETLPPQNTETPHHETEQKQNSIFNFNFLQNSAEDEETQQKQKEKNATAPQTTVQEETVPLSDLLKPEDDLQETTHQKETKETPATKFSFNLFQEESKDKKEHKEENDLSFLAAREEESKSTLINQIKHDIEEIDQDVQVEPSEKEDAGQKLESLLHTSMQQPKQESVQNTETTPSIEQPQSFSFNFQPTQTADNNPQETNRTVKPDFPEEFPQHETNSFEETLKNIFSTEQDTPQAEENSLNNIELNRSIQEPKQSVTTEAIKSPHQNETPSTEALVLPKLGSLGLSREEELDFIEEFLDDTAATVGLMQEYLKLEDYSNIKYNLIKIASSAEILHFDQMLAHTRELTSLCDAEQKESVAQKLQDLLQLVKRYKTHFSSMPV